MALHRTAWVLDHLAILSPGQTGDADRVLKLFEKVEEQLFTIATADKIHLRTLQFDERSIQARKDAAEGQFDLRIGGTNLTG